MSIMKRDASWSFLSGPPQRYTMNYGLYAARGGAVRPVDDMLRFAPEGKGSGDSARFWLFCLVLDQLMKEGLEGELAEVGVYQGRTAALLATAAQRLGRTVYLFDTFEGFAESDVKGIDAGRINSFTDTSLEAVRTYVGETAAQYIKGYFPDSTAQVADDIEFCLVHIDCDLYLPIRSSLEYFYPRMVPGGFIIIHDYSGLGWPGAERAVDEFFADKPESVMPLPDVGGSAMVRKAKASGIRDNWRVRRIRNQMSAEWTNAGKNAFGMLLGAGWSAPEPNEVWGIGPVHELEIARLPGEEFVLEAEVRVFLPQPADTQEIDVVVGGDVVASWSFSTANQRGIRTARIPAAGLPKGIGDGDLSLVSIQFRLRNPHRNPEVGGRQLGMSLVRMRLNPVPRPSSDSTVAAR